MKPGGRLKRKRPIWEGPTTVQGREQRRRGKKKRGVQMGDDTGFAAFVRRLPCAACFPGFYVGTHWVFRAGRRAVPPSTVAHIRTRAAGHGVLDRDGQPNMLPLCQCHHGEQHTIGWEAMRRRYKFNEVMIAATVATWWKQETTNGDENPTTTEAQVD